VDAESTRAVGDGDSGWFGDGVSDVVEGKSGWRSTDCGVSRDNNSRINRAVNARTRARTPCLSRDRKSHDGCCNIQQSHLEASSPVPESECVVGDVESDLWWRAKVVVLSDSGVA